MEATHDRPRVTILVAEDEEPLRELVNRILKQDERYVLLMAENWQDAAHIANQHQGQIDLLLSNVQMPGVSGPDLARMLRKSRPELRVMLMSGYPQGLLLLDHGWTFLQKPFLPSKFLEVLERALTGPNSGDGMSGQETLLGRDPSTHD